MKKICLGILSLNFIFCFVLVAQGQVNEAALKLNLKQHITILASDSFEGRETGKKGEQLAYSYIINQFKQTGLEAKGSDGYLQPFPFEAGKKTGKNNVLEINKKKFEVNADFFPLPFSSAGSVAGEAVKVGYGIEAPALNRHDYENRNDLIGKIFIIETSTPDGSNPHGKFSDYYDLQNRVDSAIAKGAAGVIFINSNKETEDPVADYTNKYNRKESVPVIFVKARVHQTLLQDRPQMVSMNADLEKIELTGHNVIGYLDNKAASTIVIGAHYDHLGSGGHESLYRGKPAIHNGADDNASGIAALIELGRMLKNSSDKSNNYLLIAFSGEEKGLLGSNYFVKNPTIPLQQINYMINMDMVGRLKKEERTLIIAGTGTSVLWKNAFEKLQTDSLKFKLTESGVGPSDHTSFYLKDIPVLHFFSGSHEDYHKPSDDEDKINYEGEIAIFKVIASLIHELNDKGKLAFIKTNDSNNEEVPRFKVTLGVIPDYAFEGEGMRIDGVSDGKPASHAGLKSGDVVVQLGDYPVSDMMSYMKALGKFSKGETTIVKYKREKEVLETKITF